MVQFCYPTLLFRDDYTLFVILLSLVSIGWIDMVIVVFSMTAILVLCLFFSNPIATSIVPVSSFWCGIVQDKEKFLLVMPSSTVE